MNTELVEVMDKEKIITVGIGLIVGILLATVYFVARENLLPTIENLGAKQKAEKVSPKPLISPPVSAIVVDSPEDYLATTSGILAIRGRAAPGSRIIIFSNAEEKIASADGQGSFSVDVSLEEGENVISLTSLGKDGKVASTQRKVLLEVTP